MKKIVFTVLSVLSFFAQVQAQNPARFGVVGGIQSSTIRGQTLSSDGKFGFNLGGVAELSLSDKFLIRPQLLYSSKGGVYQRYRDTYSYIEIPVHAVYKAEVGQGKLFGGVGPYFAFLASATNSIGLNLEEVKGFDAGLSLMGGYELTEQKLSFNLFYNTGLTSIYSDASVSQTVTNGTFGLSVAYYFGD
jgi:hypothetical protein